MMSDSLPSQNGPQSETPSPIRPDAIAAMLANPSIDVRLLAIRKLISAAASDAPDPIPHLLKRIQTDDSLVVRQTAVAVLAEACQPDVRALPVLASIVKGELDTRLRSSAQQGLERYAAAGLSTGA